jgi:hypothetical protein
MYIHEDMAFKDMITKLLFLLKREELHAGIEMHRGQLVHAPFKLSYTITRTAYKNISIESADEYKTMMENAQAKTNAALVLTALEVKASIALIFSPYLV